MSPLKTERYINIVITSLKKFLFYTDQSKLAALKFGGLSIQIYL